MKKGFVVSWFYPPGNSSEGLVTYKLLKNSKLEYDVFAKDNENAGVWDRNLVEATLQSENIKIICGSSNDRRKWANEAVAYFVAHQDEYDFVMSRAMPPECHDVAARIKRLVPGVKWIASFGDPLVRTPYVDTADDMVNPYAIKTMLDRELGAMTIMKSVVSPLRLVKSLYYRHERNAVKKVTAEYRRINDITFREADKLIFNNGFQLEHAFDGEYEDYASKSIVLPHSFDSSFYHARQKNIRNKRTKFLYTGHLDSMRNARQLLRAVKRLKENDRVAAKSLRFDFYGDISDGDKLYILNSKLYDIVKLHGPIRFSESLEKMCRADWLLNIDANLADRMSRYIFLPAKLIDYFGAGVKIFNITSLAGASADAVRSVGGGVCVSHSVNEIYMYLSKIVYAGFVPPKYDEKRLSMYDAKHVAKMFDEMVGDIIGRSIKRCDGNVAE